MLCRSASCQLGRTCGVPEVGLHLLTWVIGVFSHQGMIVRCVVASALFDLPAAAEPAVVAWPLLGVEDVELLVLRHEVAVLRRGNPEAPPGLGGSSGVRRSRPKVAADAAGASIGHAGHDPALASSLGSQEAHVSEPSRASTCR
jgi:hypothetical protein